MAIDFEAIASIVMRKAHCDRNAAWDAISLTWLQVDKTVPEKQQAGYLIQVAPLKVLTDAYSTARYLVPMTHYLNPNKSVYDDHVDDEDDSAFEMFVAPERQTTDLEYLKELIRHVPKPYRLSVIVVAKHLLDNECQRKPLSVEMARQYLKAAGIPNTSEMARQVYTYLTTIKRSGGIL